MAMQQAHRAGAQTAARRVERDPAHEAWTVLPPRRRDGERLAEVLGWFSVGIGVVALVIPRTVARVTGVGDGETARLVLRLVGLRELVSGAGILNRRRPTGWLWGRVAGDAIDLGLLVLGSRRGRRGRTLTAAAAVAGVTALDVATAADLSRDRDGGARALPAEHAVRARSSVTVDQPREVLYRFWRDFTNLPRFMRQLQAVQSTGDRRSRWTARGPAGMRVEWESEVTDDWPGELIAWRSLPGARLRHSGVVLFRRAPAGRGTIVTVEMQYTPLGGLLGARIAKVMGQAPEQQLRDDLRRFKQLMEAGEITMSEGAALGLAQPLGARPVPLAEAERSR